MRKVLLWTITSLKVNSVLNHESSRPIQTSILSRDISNVSSLFFFDKARFNFESKLSKSINQQKSILFLQNLKKYNSTTSIYFYKIPFSTSFDKTFRINRFIEKLIKVRQQAQQSHS